MCPEWLPIFVFLDDDFQMTFSFLSIMQHMEYSHLPVPKG